MSSGLLPASGPNASACPHRGSLRRLQLVHFDRKHASVDVAVAHGLDRVSKGHVDGLHAITQEIVKTHRQGKAEFAAFGLRDDSIRSIF